MNTLGQLGARLVNAGNRLLNSALSLLNPLDRSTMPKRQFAAMAAKLGKLQRDDIDHILQRSINPKYIIPDSLHLQLNAMELMDRDTGKLDPTAIKVAEHIKLSRFHNQGEGKAAARLAEQSARRLRIQGDMAIFKGDKEEAKVWYGLASIEDEKAETQFIRTYTQLAAYQSRTTKTPSTPSPSIQDNEENL